MFYRRKIILSLLQLFDDQLDKIRLQKLLFLFTRHQTKPEYDFVPYKYGCYSYSANADLTTMVSKGILDEREKYFLKQDTENYLNQIKPSDLIHLHDIKSSYGKMEVKELMRHTYINYPFYAIKSDVAEKILTKNELEIVKKSNPQCRETVLFTIGYEGISLEEYLVKLLKKDVKILVDVRNNPLSMKYGFSKNQLKKYCDFLGIKYVHFPEVGIQSDQRRELNTQSDYDKLFTIYCNQNLTKTVTAQTQILNLLKSHKRIALTCFEANICQCHRKHLAEAIKTLPGFEYKVEHI